MEIVSENVQEHERRLPSSGTHKLLRTLVLKYPIPLQGSHRSLCIRSAHLSFISSGEYGKYRKTSNLKKLVRAFFSSRLSSLALLNV